MFTTKPAWIPRAGVEVAVHLTVQLPTDATHPKDLLWAITWSPSPTSPTSYAIRLDAHLQGFHLPVELDEDNLPRATMQYTLGRLNGAQLRDLVEAVAQKTVASLRRGVRATHREWIFRVVRTAAAAGLFQRERATNVLRAGLSGTWESRRLVCSNIL